MRAELVAFLRTREGTPVTGYNDVVYGDLPGSDPGENWDQFLDRMLRDQGKSGACVRGSGSL